MVLSHQMKISIIIPTLNEENNIGLLINYLIKNSNSENIQEIIVIDGGSLDRTVEIVKELGMDVKQGEKGRAKQMN